LVGAAWTKVLKYNHVKLTIWFTWDKREEEDENTKIDWNFIIK
jgi:hypothetical protein